MSNIRKSILIPILTAILLLPVTGGDRAHAEMGSRLLVFNKLGDLLKGDTWESITQEELGRYFFIYPERYNVLGIGTTNQPYRMGEILVRGPITQPLFSWINPEYPYRIRPAHEGEYPWIQLALYDPEKRRNWVLEDTKNLHEELIARLRRAGISLCALSIEAVARKVEYSLTVRIPEMDLDPECRLEKEKYSKAYRDDSRSRWLFTGIFADDEFTAKCGMPPGQPLLLVGYNRDTDRGGLVKSATLDSARVQYNEIESLQVFESDLKVSDIRVTEKRIFVHIRNDGDLTAEHVKVRLLFVESRRGIEVVLPGIRPKEEQTVRFHEWGFPAAKTLRVVVDPENRILESDETNNDFVLKRPLLGW